MPDGFEDEIFPIPLYPGLNGTPKMVKWLSDEVGRRYRNIHGITVNLLSYLLNRFPYVLIPSCCFFLPQPQIKKIQARKEGSDNVYCTLGSEDVIEHVIEPNSLLVAICKK